MDKDDFIKRNGLRGLTFGSKITVEIIDSDKTSVDECDVSIIKSDFFVNPYDE